MASYMTDSERQKLLLQQEIAKLSGAISRAAGTSSNHHGTHPYSRPGRGTSYRGASRGTTRGRGRGRGSGGSSSYALDLRQPSSSTSAQAGPSTTSAPPPRKKSEESEKEEGEVSPNLSGDEKEDEMRKQSALVEAKRKQLEADKAAAAQESWVAGTSKRGNMSLMTIEKRNQLKSQPPKPQQSRKQRIPPSVQVLNSTSNIDGTQKVVIDGVIFQFEPGGSKLTRIGELDSSNPADKGNSGKSTLTRRRLDFAGKSFRRTSRGNMITGRSKEELAKRPCRYYTKTGRCNRALTCPYLHNPSHLSICPKFLRGNCPHASNPSECPLSHTPSAHNTPSCVHFQATSTCRNGPKCVYPHVKVSSNAGVCEEFVRDGWCSKKEGTCEDLHVWECITWREKGVCVKNGKCGLRHVLRAKGGLGEDTISARNTGKGKGKGRDVVGVVVVDKQNGNDNENEKEDVDVEIMVDVQGIHHHDSPPGGGFEEQDEFIGFEEQGSPGLVISESDEEDEEEVVGGEEGENDDEDEDDNEIEDENGSEEEGDEADVDMSD